MNATARDQQIAAHVGLVHHVARHYRGRGDDEDIVQAGLLGLIHAVDHFDPDRGMAFSSYAVPCITGAIKHHLRDTSSTIRVPGRVQELAAQVARAIDELTAAAGRSPTLQQVAERLGVSLDDVVGAIEADHARSPVSTDDEEGPAATLGQADAAFELVEDREAVLQALRSLPLVERRAVELRFYGGRTQTQIAEELGVSQMQVSRLLARALRRLREQLSGA